ncbi:MAG: glutamine amidotransferase, partial [Pyrinomonadaceae bacterium]
GGWGRSRFHDALPVECLQHDALVESTAGYAVRCRLPEHPTVRGLDWSTVPPLLGFNECRVREGGDCVVEIENQGRRHPLLAERRLGAGRVTCWMTGASPHWGINFMKWPDYRRFWSQLFNPQT